MREEDNKFVKNLSENVLTKKIRVILYGLGENYRRFMSSDYSKTIDVVAYIDEYKKNTFIDGQFVHGINDIGKFEFDEIFVLPADSKTIIYELVHNQNIESDRIRDCRQINEIIINSFNDFQYVMIGDNTEFLNYPYQTLSQRKDFLFFVPLLQKESFDLDKPKDNIFRRNIRFILRDHCYYYTEFGLIKFIKSQYPESRWITVMSDMCEGDFGRFATRGNDYLDRLKETFELVITYHSGDANKYGLTHLEQTYPLSKMQGQEQYDVLFVGKAKNRLDFLHEAFFLMTQNGISCKFWISDVEPELQLDVEGIIYNRFMSYSDYLLEVSKSKIIFEICQMGNESTYRYDEAIVNNKRLISNDPSILKRKYFNKEYMLYISSVKDIDIEWIKKDINVEYNYSDDYSPNVFLQFIEKNLVN